MEMHVSVEEISILANTCRQERILLVSRWSKGDSVWFLRILVGDVARELEEEAAAAAEGGVGESLLRDRLRAPLVVTVLQEADSWFSLLSSDSQ